MNRYDESNKVTIISILLNIGLTILKILSGILGNSAAIIADGVHSASDII
ncbi:MAG: cation transporter, partial [Clostridium celatum]|nr:cation transporter [Clostridium celatum]